MPTSATYETCPRVHCMASSPFKHNSGIKSAADDNQLNLYLQIASEIRLATH